MFKKRISNGVKKVSFLILAVFLAISPSLIRADNSASISYLQSQNQNAWITQALVAAGVSNPNVTYVDSSTNDLMTAVKNLLALSAVGSTDISALESLLATIDANMSGGQVGSSDLLNDDFWALLALASVGQTDSTDTIKNFILDHQNDDGGWSWSTTGSSDSNDTAAAIMALLEVGVDNNSTEMTAALAYLKNTQNTDGGFAYDVAGSSDGASTAWVIAALNKIGSDSSAWEVSDNDPLSFLQSLEQEDGSYLWLPSDENGSAMVTAYALVALSGKFYPVNYIELEEEQTSVGIDLRIEGPDNTICLATALDVGTVLDVLAAGAEVCGYEYETQDSAYGVYVSSIDGIDAAGMDGWQYFINWSGGTQAAGDYQLSEGDDVLWAYGGWPLYAAKVEVNTTDIASNESLVVTATYFDGTTWQAQSGANIYIGDQLYQANSSGQLTIAMASDGIYPVWSQIAEQYTRSNKIYLIVGSGVSETVDLLVDIDNDTGGPGQDTIAFSVSQSSINFGTLSAGQSAQTTIALTNTGTTNIYIEASVIGDSVFSDYTSLNQSIWEDYSVSIARSNSSAVNVGLALPASLDTNGQKTGQLIFWAINN